MHVALSIGQGDSPASALVTDRGIRQRQAFWSGLAGFHFHSILSPQWDCDFMAIKVSSRNSLLAARRNSICRFFLTSSCRKNCPGLSHLAQGTHRPTLPFTSPLRAKVVLRGGVPT